MSHLPVSACTRILCRRAWSRRDSNPRPLDPKSITLRRRPGKTRTRSGEGIALCQLSYGPLPSCCPAPCRPSVWVARRNARPWHRESRVHVLRAPRPPATLRLHGCSIVVRHLLGPVVSPRTKIAPPGLCAGGAIVSLPGCGSGHALTAPTLPQLPRWSSFPASCSRAVAGECRRVRNRSAYRDRCRMRRTGARPHPADRRTPATPRATRDLRPSADCRRVRRASVPASVRVGTGCRAGGTDPPETKNRAADVLPEPGLRDPLRGPWRARVRGGRWNIGTRLP